MIEIFGTELFQWDTGRSVKVTEIEADHVHFANKGDSKAVIMDIADSLAKIPDYLLQTGKQLCVYAVKNGVTVESKIIYVKNRERPESYVYEEDQRNYIYALITNAEEAIEGANQAAGVAAQAAAVANTASDNANLATENANASAGSAALAAKNANDAADNANHTAKSLMVIGSAKGNSIHLDGASDQFLLGMRIFGKTTQDGTPTPESPVNMESVGDSGSVGITVSGKNLVDLRGFEFDDSAYVHNIVGNASAIALYEFLKANAGKTVVMSMTKTGTDSSSSSPVGQIRFYKDGALICILTPGVARKLEELPDTFGECYIYGSSTGASVKDIQIEFGETPTAYEPFTGSTLTVSTPNGLPGIPVTTGGNYIDADGQQWVCDEIDFAKGVYVKRIQKDVFDGTESWSYYNSGNNPCFTTTTQPATRNAAMSSHFKHSNYPYTLSSEKTGFFGWDSSNKYLYFSSAEASVANWKAWLATNHVTVIYALATHIETPLSEEEIAAYAALRTYRGNTTVSNDAGAWMDIEYVMDAKKYIDDMIHPVARLASVSLPASKWTGSGNLYSQVVYIDGITENSQVNLTPTVSQMTIFYEKDITFITENDGGVVTIYVIGQKPTNDYVIPANIVEVRV